MAPYCLAGTLGIILGETYGIVCEFVLLFCRAIIYICLINFNNLTRRYILSEN